MLASASQLFRRYRLCEQNCDDVRQVVVTVAIPTAVFFPHRADFVRELRLNRSGENRKRFEVLRGEFAQRRINFYPFMWFLRMPLLREI